MRRSHALFLIVLVGVAAAFASYASASGQCTQPPSSGGGSERGSGSGCGAAAVDGDDDEIIKTVSSIDFEKTIAGEVDEPEDAITLVLFEGEEKRPAVSAAFKQAASALEGLGVQAAVINSVADQGLSKVQGGGAGKTAVRAFFSTLHESSSGSPKTGERRPTNVAAGGAPLVAGEDDGDGPLADPSAIAAVALEAVAAAAASRLGVEASALLSRSPPSSASCSCSSKKGKASTSSCSSCSKKKEEAEKKKAEEEEGKKNKKKDSNKSKKEEEKKRDSKAKKKSGSKEAGGGGGKGGGKKGKRGGGRVNEGGGYFSSSRDIDALGDSTFDANVLSADSKATMVMFYAPWCGHCKQLAPDYERLPQLLATKHGNPDARVAAVDCDKHKQVCSRQGVQGFPTLKFFKGGKGKGGKASAAEDYRGPRDADSLAAFIAERAPKRPAEVAELTGDDVLQASCPPAGNSAGSLDAEEAAALPRLCLFAFVPSLRDSSARERNALLGELRKVAAEFAGRPYSITWAAAGAHPRVEEAFALGYGFPALVAYVPPDAVRGGPARASHLKGKFDAKSIVSFVERVRGGGGGGASGVDPSKVVAAEPGVVEPWDGKDFDPSRDSGSGKDDEEFSLADLGLDLPSAGKDEL